MILARRLVAAAALAVAVLIGGAWLVAGESPPAAPVATQAVAVALEALPPRPEPAPEDDPQGDDPIDLAPWAASVGVELAEDLAAWRRFAVAAPTVPEGAPAIAILIDDMGEARAWSDRPVALPGPLTLAFFPHAPDLAAQVDAARRAGHEIMLHMPMEPDDTAEDPGPEALLTGLDEAELRRRTVAMLDSFTGYVGVNNHMGSRFTRDAAALATVLAEVAARGLLFVDSRTASGTLGERIARELQAEADAEARKERQKLERKAQLASVLGRSEKAEELREEAVTQTAPIVTSAAPKIAGLARRETWKAEVVNLAVLVEHIAKSGPVLLPLISINQSELNRLARELKEDLNLPGVKVLKEASIVARANS